MEFKTRHARAGRGARGKSASLYVAFSRKTWVRVYLQQTRVLLHAVYVGDTQEETGPKYRKIKGFVNIKIIDFGLVVDLRETIPSLHNTCN